MLSNHDDKKKSGIFVLSADRIVAGGLRPG